MDESQRLPDESSDPMLQRIASTIRGMVPPVYAPYEPAIVDSFVYFLKRLDVAKRSTIETTLQDLDFDQDPFLCLLVVLRECPTLHKLGQVLARDPRLDPEVRSHLQELETFPATISNEELTGLVEAELGSAMDTYQIDLVTSGAMEASIAYVIPAFWTSPGAERKQRAVLKILKPNLKKSLDAELEVLGEIAQFLDERCEFYGLPTIPYQETFDSVRTLLSQESDLSAELENLAEAWDALKSNSRIQLPRPLDFSSPGCIAMRYMPGKKITEAAEKMTPRERHALAKALAKAMICDPLLSKKDTTLIHGDPHAGNLKYTDDHRVGILDWSLVSRLHKKDREALVTIVLGAITLSPKRIEQGLQLMDVSISDQHRTRSTIDEALSVIRNEKPPGLKWFTTIFDDLVQSGVVFPGRFAMLRKNFYTIEGVLADIDPKFSLTKEFVKQALITAASEVPKRALKRPGSRDYRFPLANVDVAALITKGPLNALRSLTKSKPTDTKSAQ
jgi:ubiquinone biosynthesis protein